MKYIKLFEDKETISLLCVGMDTKFAENKFTIGKLYDAIPLITFPKSKSMKYSFNYKISDDNGDKQGLLKLMNVDEYVCTIGGRFTKDKSLEDYQRRMVTQQFDL